MEKQSSEYMEKNFAKQVKIFKTFADTRVGGMIIFHFYIFLVRKTNTSF